MWTWFIILLLLCTSVRTGVFSEESTSGYSFMSNPLTMTTIVNKPVTFSGRNVTTAANVSEDQTTEPPYSPANETCTGSCNNLPASCYDCNSSNECIYGSSVTFQCMVKTGYQCSGSRNVNKVFSCTYCFLMTENVDYTCNLNFTDCHVKAAPPQRFNTTCTVRPQVFCLGKRTFIKSSPCNWTSGYKWYTALALSVTLGGFGADRFYLGYWKEGMGKLFSFGGLGVWTLIDIVLIGTQYLMPADGSLYIS